MSPPEMRKAGGSRPNVTHAITEAPIVAHVDSTCPTFAKRGSTAQARLALRGMRCALIEGDDGRPLAIVSLGAWTRTFTSIDELEKFVDAAVGRHG